MNESSFSMILTPFKRLSPLLELSTYISRSLMESYESYLANFLKVVSSFTWVTKVFARSFIFFVISSFSTFYTFFGVSCLYICWSDIPYCMSDLIESSLCLLFTTFLPKLYNNLIILIKCLLFYLLKINPCMKKSSPSRKFKLTVNKFWMHNLLFMHLWISWMKN